MSRDSQNLVKALRELPHVTELQVFYASSILSCCGLGAALAYIKGLKDHMCPTLPLEAAEAVWHEEIQEESPCQS